MVVNARSSRRSSPDLAREVVVAIEDLDRLNILQEAAYARCNAAFGWHERGRALLAAMHEALRPGAAPTVYAPAAFTDGCRR
jgi:hypothetical protein